MKPQHCLVLDVGGHAARAHLYDRSGRRVAAAERTIDTQLGEGGRVEHQPTQLLAACREAMAECLALVDSIEHGVPFGISCQRASVLGWCLGDATALSPVLSWQDSRAAAHIRALESEWSALQAISGLRPNAFVGASKLAWLIKNNDRLRDELTRGRAVVGPLGSFLQQALMQAPRPRCSYTLAQRTLLFDIQQLRWSAHACDLFEIEPAWLPPVAPDLQTQDEDELAFDGGVKLRCQLQCGDQNLLPAALSQHGVSPIVINLGTGAFVLGMGECADPNLLRSVLPGSALGELCVEGTVNSAGAAFDFLARRYGWQDIPWDAIGTPSIEAPRCLPAVNGLGSPDWLSDARFQFSAEPVDDQAAITATAEGVACLLKRNLDRMGSASNEQAIALGGGLSRSKSFCQLLADMLQRELYTVDELELSSYGAARLLWRQNGIDLPAPRRVDVYRPQPALAELMRFRYAQWCADFLNPVRLGA